jgi:peptidoglycan-N-acetylglucosamine deacetylase
MIHRTPFFLPLLFPSLIWRITTEEKELYLTFDDGPVPGPTEFVLETLAKFNAKATFFCIGDNIKKHPHVFKKIIDNGHAIGNHTFNHLNGWKTSADRYVANVGQCSSEIHANTIALNHAGPFTAMFRPPYGRITRNQIRALGGFKIIMWDVLSIDYDAKLASAKCLNNTIQASRYGSIIVFHDSYKAEKNLTVVLPEFIAHFAALGFTFKTLNCSR